jgi:hypothetical protein
LILILHHKKSGTKVEGHEIGALAYSTAENLALLSIIRDVPNSFNSSTCSEEWRKVYSSMASEYDILVRVHQGSQVPINPISSNYMGV